MFVVKVFAVLFVIKFIHVDAYATNYIREVVTIEETPETIESVTVAVKIDAEASTDSNSVDNEDDADATIFNTDEKVTVYNDYEETTASVDSYEDSIEVILPKTKVSEFDQIFGLTIDIALPFKDDYNDTKSEVYQKFAENVQFEIESFYAQKFYGEKEIAIEICLIMKTQTGIKLSGYVYAVQGIISFKCLKAIIENNELFQRIVESERAALEASMKMV